jgi:glycerophosphoryl diester phosphodiesterase
MLLVAHRTPASRVRCARLAAAGARVFEVDVQLGSGGIAVSHYLPFGRGGLVQRDNWRLRWHTSALRDPEVSEVAGVVPPECALLLDIKEKVAARRRELTAAIVETLADRARYIVCGAQPEDLEHVRNVGFATWRTVGGRRELSAVLAEGALADDGISVRHSLLTGVSLDRLHTLTSRVVAWTVNDPARARQLRDLGADGVTTDHSGVLRALAPEPRND